MSHKLPVWEPKYKDLGVSPSELYIRQQGLCWLEFHTSTEEVELLLQCTDGVEMGETSKMLNPTFECVKCMSSFIVKQESDKKNE